MYNCLISALIGALIFVFFYVFIVHPLSHYEGFSNKDMKASNSWGNSNSEVILDGTYLKPKKNIKRTDVIIDIGKSTPIYTLNRKAKLYIFKNAQTNRALSASAKKGVYADASIDPSQSWEYNPDTGSICPSNNTNVALTINGNNLEFHRWDSNNPKMKWYIIMAGRNQGAIIHRSSNYAIENGGGASSGEQVKAYPMDNLANKYWSIAIIDFLTGNLFPKSVPLDPTRLFSN